MKPTKDFFIECNEGAMMNPPEFERTFCNRCKNRDCVRSGWAFTQWDKRILTQVDRLLVNPNIVGQNESSRWEGVPDFERFNEPVVEEIWGITNKPNESLKEEGEPDTLPSQPIPPPPSEEVCVGKTHELDKNNLTSDAQQKQYTNPLNTPTKDVLLGNPAPRPKNFQSDPWAVTETLPVGGKFKMGK